MVKSRKFFGCVKERAVLLLFLVALCFSLISFPAFGASNNPSYQSDTPFWYEDYSNHYFGKQLRTSQEKELYNALEQDIFTYPRALKSRKVIFSEPLLLPSSTNLDNHSDVAALATIHLQRAVDAFRFDHPEMYWVTGGSAITNLSVGHFSDGEKGILTASATFLPLDSNYAVDDAVMTSKINQLVAEAGQQTGDFNRLRYVHDSLAKNIKYDLTMPPVYRSHQITGGLVDQKGVCETYSKIFKLVAERLGYETVLVGGLGYDRGQAVPHMWNYVKVQGQWYGVDITWDDQAITIPDYLLVGRDTPSPNFSGNTFGSTHQEEYTFHSANYENFYYPPLASEMLQRGGV